MHVAAGCFGVTHLDALIGPCDHQSPVVESGSAVAEELLSVAVFNLLQREYLSVLTWTPKNTDAEVWPLRAYSVTALGVPEALQVPRGLPTPHWHGKSPQQARPQAASLPRATCSVVAISPRSSNAFCVRMQGGTMEHGDILGGR